jgi:hypothetical protein
MKVLLPLYWEGFTNLGIRILICNLSFSVVRFLYDNIGDNLTVEWLWLSLVIIFCVWMIVTEKCILDILFFLYERKAFKIFFWISKVVHYKVLLRLLIIKCFGIHKTKRGILSFSVVCFRTIILETILQLNDCNCH